MSTSNEEVHKVTGPPRSEPTIAVEHQETDVIYIEMKADYCDSLIGLVDPYLPGCGVIELISLKLIFTATSDTSYVYAGVCSTAQSLSAIQISMKPNGVNYVANSMTKGIRHVVDIIPEDILSTQLQPVSAKLPALKFVLDKSSGMTVVVMVSVRVHGIRSHFGTLTAGKVSA